MAWLFLFVVIPVAWLLWNIVSFSMNYRRARQIGLPIVMVPLSTFNPIWLLVHKQMLPLLMALPWNIDYFRYSYAGWTFADKYQIHERLGPAFVQVNPLQIELCVADAKAASAILTRRKDFPKPLFVYSGFSLYPRYAIAKIQYQSRWKSLVPT